MGPMPDIHHGDPAILYSCAQHLNYYAILSPGLVMQIDPLGFSPGQPRWFVTFHLDKMGYQRFHEAGSGVMLVKDLWEFVEYLLAHCRRTTPVPKTMANGMFDNPYGPLGRGI
jgi:hypothetical protein